MSAIVEARPELELQRVRHAPKFRLLQVARVSDLTPYLRRVTLAGEELEGFQSASFDDHVKVFFPAPGSERPARPLPGPSGMVFPEGVARPVSRDFTPRRFDAAAHELDLEFVMHEAGPAAEWARQARVGQYLGIGGPRGSMVIPVAFDWHLLVGDETALPAIARRLEELPSRATALVVVEIPDGPGEIKLPSAADLHIRLCRRRAADPIGAVLMQELQRLVLPAGEGFTWAAGESSVIRDARAFLCGERGIHKSRIRAASYWRRGAVGVHERFDD